MPPVTTCVTPSGESPVINSAVMRSPSRPQGPSKASCGDHTSVVVATTDEGQPDGHPRRPGVSRDIHHRDLQDRPYAVERCVPGGVDPDGRLAGRARRQNDVVLGGDVVDLGTAAVGKLV